MARYIDTDKLTNQIDEWLDSVGNALIGKGLSYYGELMGCIEDTPTADVVEVVRCKDCKWFGESTYVGGRTYTGCKIWGCDDLAPCEENDYCSCGERKCDNDKENAERT